MRHAPVGVVIGGGLLGLEAANALRTFGLHAHVVEMAPRLMAQQLDEAGGALLGRMISDLGIDVHVGVGTESSIEARPTARDRCVVTLSDGTVVDAGVVIFAAGVRPRDELARSSRSGELPTAAACSPISSCATKDPNIYAIGEVAAIEGRCYGLVGPGYTSAEVVADRLLGGAAEFPGADMSTKLKLLGVDVASFGDAMGTTPDCLEVVGQRRRQPDLRQAGALRRRQDAARRHSGRRRLRLWHAAADGRRALPGDPMALISPAGSDGGAAQLGVGALPAARADLLVQQRHQG